MPFNCKFSPWLAALAASLFSYTAYAAEPVSISGIYPRLATFNEEGECGTGAVVPWADRLWVISYGPHRPLGSTDKLYEITPDRRQIIRPESVGGTPANRMIHRESQQLVIGPYFIDTNRHVRVVAPKFMPGRLTANARDLADPANKIYFATMEEGLYEVDMHSLAVTGLIKDNNPSPPGKTTETNPAKIKSTLPGYHGKGLYSGQGRVIYAQNGEHGRATETDPTTTSGALAEWRAPGEDWQLIRRNQFTEVTGPGGIYGNAHPATDPVWSLGWDFRSLILACLDHGTWHAYRLPKPDHSYDGAHGWFTEWPRIRDIGEDDLLMTMHGAFWHFPTNFCAANSAGIAPRSSYLKIIGDFCRWQDRVVIGCDDAAIIEVPRKLKGRLAPTGQSQSNLQFLKPAQLDEFGPALGHGAVWLDDSVKAGEVSDPFLFSGYKYRTLILSHNNPQPVTFTLEADAHGNGVWEKLRDIEVSANGSAWTEFAASETGAWLRVKANRDCEKATACFQFHNADQRSLAAADIFSGVAQSGDTQISGGLLHQRGGNARTLQCISADGKAAGYELDGNLKLRQTNDPVSVAWAKTNLAIPRDFLTVDKASVICVDNGHRWRLPKGEASFEQAGAGDDERVCREVVTERDLFNAFGTFYELPAESAGGFIKIRPIATHNRHIKDYASYRGLLVMSGVRHDATGEHIIRSDDGKCALWVGAVDDLWQLGKPRGTGGPWFGAAVKANEPSDAYLATGYDEKRLTLSHESTGVVNFKVQADFTGTGEWRDVVTLAVKPGERREYDFPNAFAAYWFRVVAASDTVATAQFDYR
jgi:hypothetical protein